MNDISLGQLIKPIVIDFLKNLFEPFFKTARNDLLLIDTKEARRLTCQSVSGWQEIANLPEMRAIEHRKKTKSGGRGTSIYYFPDEFKKVVPRLLREKVLD
ncbi:hypothetical protein ACQW5G_01315 [Fructilactobacillus sp. Tb1]|uniref:hypothetical protein n=1 Tax=Fructilactobacillus sp. Tb1 TaxID=3422304 RepID=UPI003D27EAC5